MAHDHPERAKRRDRRLLRKWRSVEAIPGRCASEAEGDRAHGLPFEERLRHGRAGLRKSERREESHDPRVPGQRDRGHRQMVAQLRAVPEEEHDRTQHDHALGSREHGEDR